MAKVYAIMGAAYYYDREGPVENLVLPLRWTMNDIREDLIDIARSEGIELDPDDMSAELPPEGPNVELDIYTIIELEVEDRG